MKSTLALELKSKVDNHLDLWKIEFKPIVYREGKLVWSVPKATKQLPSIIIFRSGETVVSFHCYAGNSHYRKSVHQRVSTLFARCGKNDKIDNVAIVPVPLDQIWKTINLYRQQAAYLEQEKVVERIKAELHDPQANPSSLLSKLDFREPFVDHAAKPREYTFLRKHYYYLSGVYVVLTDKQVYYVGQSLNLYARMYAHWIETSGIVKGRPDKELAKFNHLFSEYQKVEVAMIDVPMVINGKDGFLKPRDADAIRSEIDELEYKLTKLLKPIHIDSRIEPFVHSPPSDEPAPF